MKRRIAVMTFGIWFSMGAQAGDTAGHGSGPAEKNLIFAHVGLPRYISFCLSSKLCRLSPAEAELLKNVALAHPAEGTPEAQLQFESEKKKPGTFLIEGKERVARTGDAVGDKILINTDLLYTQDLDGLTKPLSLAGAVALLIHELGHHQGVKAHGSLDLLGSKVETLLLMQMQELRGGPQWEEIDVISIVPPNVGLASPKAAITQLMVSDGTDTLDFTEPLRNALSCNRATIKNLHLWNLHWVGGREYQVPVLGDDGIARVERMLQGRLSLVCERSGAILLAEEFYDVKIRLVFERASLTKKPRLLPEIKVTQISCSEAPEHCH